jgi:hypothetical protein
MSGTARDILVNTFAPKFQPRSCCQSTHFGYHEGKTSAGVRAAPADT